MRLLTFIYHVDEGDRVRLVYDSSHGGEQTVEGDVEDAHLSEYTSVVTDTARYRVWGTGGTGRAIGEVVKRKGHNARKIGTFTDAEVVDR